MSTECVAAVDQGTQSSRCVLYDITGQVIAKHQVEFQQHCERAGWLEHEPDEIWDSVTTCIAEAMEAAQQETGGEVTVKAIGIANQRETTLVWDRHSGKPLYNAIVWSDTRTADICRRMMDQLGSSDFFREVTGLPINPYFSAYKFVWLLENVPAVKAAVEDGSALFGTIDSYLIWRLTGGTDGGQHVTDVTNASRTNFMDLRTLQWHDDTLRLFGATRQMLPSIRSNAEVYGHVAEGPLKGVPVAGCLGDQMAAMLGQRCRPQQAKTTYGTGCFVLMNTGAEPVQSSHGLLTTVGFQCGRDAEPHYALEGSIAIAGSGISWLRDKLGVISSVAESEAVAGSVANTAGVYFVPAFEGLLAPRWREDARGAVLGLTSYSSKAHIVRAMLEGICFQTREVVDAMCKDAGLDRLQVMRVDGGACSNDLLLRLQADLLQVPVHRPANLETTSLGAAYAAGIAVGFWSEQQILEDGLGSETITEFEASISAEAANARFLKWNKAVELTFGLSELSNDDT